MMTYIDTDCHIRWMIRRDMQDVEHIETVSYEFPWSEDDFIRALRVRNAISMVAEVNERVVGFMIYELHRDRLHVLNFAVHPDYRRRSIGSLMANKLKSKLSAGRRNLIMLEIRESNLPAQQFFSSQGFKAVKVVRGFYTDWTEEDAYLFQYRHKETVCQGK